ncbi:MAG: glycerophosphodiester phosphodiesterase, partial [Caldilineaceae bacterium]
FAPAYAGVGVPTLDEVFDLVGNRCRINVEIKSEEPDGGLAADTLVAFLIRRGLENRGDQVIVSSFNLPTLIRLRRLNPALPLGVLFLELPSPDQLADWLAPALAPQALHPWSPLVDDAFMAQARNLQLAVNVWTVNEPAEAVRLADLGVDAIISDVPDLLLREIRK